MLLVGVDLGQARDFTAIAVIDAGAPLPATPGGRAVRSYQLRYLERIPLGTPYTAVVDHVLTLLRRPPLTIATPLVVDKTGVGIAVVDMFRAGSVRYPGVRPRALTITGGDATTTTDPYDVRVPKRDLAGLLVALYESQRLKMAARLELAPLLITELVNFKVKINTATGNDTYEAWRESVHDDLVLAVAIACWYAENMTAQRPYGGATAGDRSAVTAYADRQKKL